MIKKIEMVLNAMEESRKTKGTYLNYTHSDSHAHYFSSNSKFDINEYAKVVIENGDELKIFTKFEGMTGWVETEKVITTQHIKLLDILQLSNIEKGLSEQHIEFLKEVEYASANNKNFELAYQINTLIRIQKIANNGGYPVAKKIISLLTTQNSSEYNFNFYTVTANFDMASHSDFEFNNYLNLEQANNFAKEMKERFLSEIPNRELNHEETLQEEELFYFKAECIDGENYVTITVHSTNFEDVLHLNKQEVQKNVSY